MDSPLQLATAARVACAVLEEELARGHHKKAAATSRKLWDRINAMACRIEDLQAEVERLQIPSAKGIAPPVANTAEPPVGSGVTFVLAPGARPPGFDRVRSKMRRENPCATIVLPEDKPVVLRRRKKATLAVYDGERRGVAAKSAHEDTLLRSVEKAIETGALVEGREYFPREIGAILKSGPLAMDNLCLDLALKRSPVKVTETGKGRWVFGQRFARAV